MLLWTIGSTPWKWEQNECLLKRKRNSNMDRGFNSTGNRNESMASLGFVVVVVASLLGCGDGFPTRTGRSFPLSVPDDEGTSLVALRLDDFVSSFRREPKDEVGDRIDALKAELDRHTAEIGGLTEALIADDRNILDLRIVVCKLLHALCDAEGSPCLPCPWKLPVTPTPSATPTTPAPTTSQLPVTTTPVVSTTKAAASTSVPPSTTTTTKASASTTKSTLPASITTTTAHVTTSTHPAVTTTPSSKKTTLGPTTSSVTTKPTTITRTKGPTTTFLPTTPSKVTRTPKVPSTTSTPGVTTTTMTSTKLPTTTTTAKTTPKPTPDPDSKCDDPKAPDNGFVVGNETKLGSHVEIKCKPGFTLVGVPQMECTALWSDETHGFSYNWAPPMSAVCKANAGYVAPTHKPPSKKNKKKTPAKKAKKGKKTKRSTESEVSRADDLLGRESRGSLSRDDPSLLL